MLRFRSTRFSRWRDAYRALFAASPWYRRAAIASAVLATLTTAVPLMRLRELRETGYIPLHYNIYVGIDQFGPWYQIFMIPLLGWALLLVNIIFEGLYFRREHVLAVFFAIFSVAAEVILAVAMVFIVLLNL